MNAPDFGTLLINWSDVWSLLVQVIFLSMAAFGVYVGFKGLVGLYELSTGSQKFSNQPTTYDSIFGKLVLAGALIVVPVIFWRFANTFVLAGSTSSVTYDQFIIGSVSADAPYCQRFHAALTYSFMGFGALAWAFAGLIFYNRTSGVAAARSGSPWIYLISGTCCFFINDLSVKIGNTIGMETNFENVCKVLG